jgi:hypothetical protein
MSVVDRDLRRHALRLLARTPDGQEHSRVLYNELLDLGYMITWSQFDALLLYLDRSGCVSVGFLRPEIDRSRSVRITQRGIDIVEGTVQEPGIMAPSQGEI